MATWASLMTATCVLALSYSGETEELLHILPAIKRFDVRVIAMTATSKIAHRPPQ